jgi:hypothetical protein
LGAAEFSRDHVEGFVEVVLAAAVVVHRDDSG